MNDTPVAGQPGLTIISLGAGVQSSALALMAAAGEITPTPDCAIFADTGGEPAAVYQWLEWLCSPGVLNFPVHIVSAGNLSEEFTRVRVAKNGNRYMRPLIPGFIKKEDGSKGMVQRQCTTDHKIRPIHRKVREILKERGEKKCLLWLGISTDEVIRMKPSRVGYIEHAWPLIDAGTSRQGCHRWMERNGFARPPRSACVYCPYHSDREWQQMKDESPGDFAKAVDVDKRWRALSPTTTLNGEMYLHRSLAPLDEVEFTDRNQMNLFGEECEGLCGV